MFEQVHHVRATDAVVARIESLILDHSLKPGDTLPSERELAAMLNVSRNALREALGILGQKGLVVARPGKGTMVAEPSPDPLKASLQLLLQLRHVTLTELGDVRILIEPELAARAAERVGDGAALTQWLERLLDAHDDPAAHVAADLGYHREIARLADHTVFSVLVDAVREPITRSMMFGTKLPRAIDHSDAQHRAVYDAIMEGNAVAARQAMTEHITYVNEYLRDETPSVISSGGEAHV
ncbi:FadR/GntR family transcriptional regulator [Glaciibacter psychrotolerans]